MEYELIEYKKHITIRKLGDVVVRYGALVMKCELAYFPAEKKPWIRMPECWLTATYKCKYVHWITKDFSDDFQKDLLNKLEKKYNLSLGEIQKLHEEGRKTKSLQKKKPTKKLGLSQP